jgi:hypothetical protein
MDQWRERLALFLGLSSKEIGQIGGGKTTKTGRLDVAVIQSLIRKGEVKDIVAEYGQVIIDECHHVSAFSFERVLKKVKAKYVVGLTATPVRKDGHHPIILMQCGPIRFNVSSKKQAAASAFQYEVIPRLTEFTVPPEWNGIGIQDIYAALVNDERRTDLVVADVVGAIEDGRFPLLLTERTEHVQLLLERLVLRVPNVFVMKGGMGKKQRDALRRSAQFRKTSNGSSSRPDVTLEKASTTPGWTRSFWLCLSRGVELYNNTSGAFIVFMKTNS